MDKVASLKLLNSTQTEREKKQNRRARSKKEKKKSHIIQTQENKIKDEK
jgi:hypothetical protein